MELILIRHATTQGNLEKRYIGITDVPIIPDGARLAHLVAPMLPCVDLVCSSPLLRCIQTADILWPRSQRILLPDLAEMNFGPFEGKNHAELLDDPLYLQWLDDPSSFDAVESVEFATSRAVKAVSYIASLAINNNLSRVAVVSHGGIIMCILSAIGHPKRDFYGWNLDNCAGFAANVSVDPLALFISASIGGAP